MPFLKNRLSYLTKSKKVMILIEKHQRVTVRARLSRRLCERREGSDGCVFNREDETPRGDLKSDSVKKRVFPIQLKCRSRDWPRKRHCE